MAPLPAGFIPGVSGLNSVEKQFFYALIQANAAGSNANAFVDEVAVASTRAIQIYPLQVQSQAQAWTIIGRISLLIPNNWAGLSTRLWAQVSPVSSATTNLPSSYQTPSALALTNWERLAAWSALALQGTFPDSAAPEGGGLRAVTAVPYSVDFSQTRSWRLIIRVSVLATADWPNQELWRSITEIGSTAINSAFL